MVKASNLLYAFAFLALPAVAHAQAATAAPAKSAKETRAEMKEERKEGRKKESHPELRAAMRELQASKTHLVFPSAHTGHLDGPFRPASSFVSALVLARCWIAPPFRIHSSSMM